jgi:rSAM/selenodomain-associated transferase 1
MPSHQETLNGDYPDRVLGLLAKWPQPGQVKSRLAAATSPEWATRVAEAFLHDTVGRLARLSVRRILACAPPETTESFRHLVQGRFTVTPQAPGDLGMRLLRLVEQLFAEGAGCVVLVGSDSPTLPLEYIEQAFALLATSDVVLGPATDGGYYLIGCRRPDPRLFAGIPWSTNRVLADTVAAIGTVGWSLGLLPPWYDVDTISDWCLLRGHLAALRAAGFDPQTPHTEQLMAESDD